MKVYFMAIIKIFISLLFYILILKINSVKILKIFALIINSFVILELIYGLIKEIRYKKQNKIIKAKEEIVLDYYKATRENSDELIKIKHDIKNQLQVAYAIAQKNERTSIGILDNIERKIENIEIINYCKNDILNAILTIKMLEAKRSGLSLNIKIDNSVKINMKEIDICNVFSNILDNSIEASKKCKNKNVTFCIFRKNNYIIIKCENAYENSFKKDSRGKMITSKLDAKNHGYGIKIIENIVNKYNGEMNIMVKNNIFKVIIIFKDNF